MISNFAVKDSIIGRVFNEDDSLDIRDCFARDRDRIIHSRAFRRLKGKTQVFISTDVDHHRTRLTHTLEVAQISRSISRYFKVNEDLTEAIALSHDLGHSPYGHAGEDILNECMSKYGGFNHNEQSFHIVTYLEKRYPLFNGLNLTFECLEGIVKHNGPLKSTPNIIKQFNDKYKNFDLMLNTYASFEAQIAAISDDIAYNHHDIDDGYRAKLITIDDLMKIKYIKVYIDNIKNKYKDISDDILISEVVRKMLSHMIQDVINTTEYNIKKLNPQSVDDIRNANQQIVCISNEMKEVLNEIKQFLGKYVYKSTLILSERVKVDEVITTLFNKYMTRCKGDNKVEQARKVSNYISGMTDSYANNYYNIIKVGDFDEYF